MKNEIDKRVTTLIVGLAQIAPVWLNREKTILKVVEYIEKAAEKGCHLITFGEAFVPGYPFWIERTDGARFNSPVQKDFFSHYVNESIQIETGDLDPICEISSEKNIAVVLGTIERAADRGGHSVYCSLVYIDQQGKIKSVHRKVMPTYEERLVWAQGDGHGLRVHHLGAFTVGGLNCWENWMPLVRTALYAQGEDLHIALWPGSIRNTQDITRFIAIESRSYVISVSGLLRKKDITSDIPHAEKILSQCSDIISDGGSCLAGPDGEWIIEPVIDHEELLVATIDHEKVKQERQNFDPSGHYSRPDVTQLTINRERQGVLKIKEYILNSAKETKQSCHKT
jgi:nitrilase